jgi:branched-chain amino acid transport system substrate-binding protein
MIRLKKTWQALCLSSLTLLGAAVATPAVAADQFIAIPSFRVGPYGTNGQSFYGGFIDYLTYVNMKDGGVNGVKFSWEECETEYNTAKGVECYERLKANAGPSKGTALHVMSTGISYGVLEKTQNDQVPLIMMGYGRTDAVDGSVFPYAFPLVTTYPMQASAILKFLAQKNKGSLAGKKIVFLYHDSAYGKEALVTLNEEAKQQKFQLIEVPVAPPGNEQGAQWLKIRQEKPDYVVFWGWGVMNQTALKAAQKVGFPRDRIIGNWWTGSEEDVIPAGAAAKGFMSATWNVSGKDVPLIKDIEKVVYGADKGNMRDPAKVGTILYNRGVSAAVITVEAVRIAQNKFGIGKVMTGSQMRWAFENIDLTNARLAKLGATGLLPEIKTSCENHEGSGKIRVQQWDGTKWVMVSDWIEGNKGMIHPMIKKSAAKYAKEKGITPGCMKD